MYTTLDVQRRLKELGFNPGQLDGVPGRLTTAAIAAFQKAEAIDVKWRGTLGERTLAALFGPGKAKPTPTTVASYPWIDLALRKKGLNESRDFSAVAAFLKSDGRTLGDPRKLPWCGDFVETCIAVTLPGEALPGNPYLARNWAFFGVPVKPTFGAVGAFWRGSRGGTNGHVAFLVGESAASFYILGGNQSNSVSIVPIAKNRLLAARWPKTVALPKISLPKMIGGKLSINEA